MTVYVIGPNDHDLMMRLVKGGPVHAKFRRMLPVIADITAPTYWWSQADTYKIGTVRNSCSFMHKGTAKPFTLEDFSSVITSEEDLQVWQKVVEQLNKLRDKYLETKDETVFEAIRCLLPSGYMQRSTLSLNYETLANMYHWRKDHRLQDWHTFCCLDQNPALFRNHHRERRFPPMDKDTFFAALNTCLDWLDEA